MEKPYFHSIADALLSVKAPQCYVVGGEAAMLSPGITITGVSTLSLSLPLSEVQAKQLIELASRAPIGRAARTTVDTAVHRAWILNPTQFSITNPQWEENLQQLLDKVKNELMGCNTRVNIICELNKLLLYEPGGFFKGFTDSDKVQGMFGTLMIQLPSNYTGGKLIVYHQGKESEFDYSGVDCCSNCYFTSFHVDCRYKVEEVIIGYRLCLIYHLIYQGLDKCSVTAVNLNQVSDIVSAMKKWQEDIESFDCPKTMTVLLEYDYSEETLSLEFLKNCDQVVADMLAQARAEVAFDVYVGRVRINILERWKAEYYHDEERYEIQDRDDISVHVTNLNDEEHMLSRVEIDDDSFVPDDFFDYVKPHYEDAPEPFEEYEDGFIINDIITVERYYEWPALLLWPVKRRMRVLGFDNMMSLFDQDVKAGKQSVHDTARDIMREMSRRRSSFIICLPFLRALPDGMLIAEMLDFIALKEHHSLNDFIEDDMFCDIVVSTGKECGWDVVEPPLQTMFNRNSSGSIEKYCSFLKRIISSGGEKDLSNRLLAVIVRVMADKEDILSTSSSESYSSWVFDRTYTSKKFVCQLLSILTTVGSSDLITSTITTLCCKPLTYPVLETLGPAIVNFCKSAKADGPLQVILSYCILQLEFTCPCRECVRLVRFLKDPNETRYRVTMAEGRRFHFYQQLHLSGVSATRITEISGTTHSLVISKNTALHNRRVKKHKQVQALLTSLWSLRSVTDVSSGTDHQVKNRNIVKCCSNDSFTVIYVVQLVNYM